MCNCSYHRQTFLNYILIIRVSSSPVSQQKPIWSFSNFFFPSKKKKKSLVKVMSRFVQTYILNKLHLECEPHLITTVLICSNRVNYLGPASLRGCVSVMDFICILNSLCDPWEWALRTAICLWANTWTLGLRCFIQRLTLNDLTRAKKKVHIDVFF